MTAQGWDQATFPVLCEPCLGETPYLRMTNMQAAHPIHNSRGCVKECKICTRPFTVFRWAPGPNERHRKTIVCQTCSKIRNSCQCCALDLQYQLPIGIRDIALKPTEALPIATPNKQYYVAKLEPQLKGDEYNRTEFGKTDSVAKEFLKRMARSSADPFKKSNATPNICPDFLNGHCKRGKECPYRHDTVQSKKDFVAPQGTKTVDLATLSVLPTDFNLVQHTSTVTVPVSDLILDESKSLLYISGIAGIINEKILDTEFRKFGDVKSIAINKRSKSAVVQFKAVKFAQVAMAHYKVLGGILMLEDVKMGVEWGRGKAIPAPPKKTVDPLMPPAPAKDTEAVEYVYPSMR